MSALRTVYLRLKSLLPHSIRDALSAVNQRFFARATILRKYGDWYEVDWRKKFRSLSDEEWSRAYDEAWRHRRNDCVEESDAEMIIAALGERGSVLEVGAGMGNLAVRLAKQGFRVTGLDVSAEALNLAREHARRQGVSIEWKQGFAESLPFLDKSFDYVTCCHTLEHVKDLAKATSELKRVARAKVVVLTPKQKFRLYAENYHTQFFEGPQQLSEAFELSKFRCTEIDCIARDNQFQGKAFLYVGELS
jgi:ubiquinone/menaquinone biosynthesis C-methylase UbiE